MLLAAHVAVGAGAAMTRSILLLADDLPHVGEDSLAARRRAFGEWAAAVERIRRVIPADGEYVLVDAQPVEQGAHFWVRHDLAPRRALFLGRMDELSRPRRLRGAIPRRLRWAVVVTGADRPPRLLTVSELMTEVAKRPAVAAGAHVP